MPCGCGCAVLTYCVVEVDATGARHRDVAMGEEGLEHALSTTPPFLHAGKVMTVRSAAPVHARIPAGSQQCVWEGRSCSADDLVQPVGRYERVLHCGVCT